MLIYIHVGGGRNHVTARFYRHFNVINYVEMSDQSLRHIFTTILSNFLSTFEPLVLEQTTSIVHSSIDIYNHILNELRATPSKPHYTFNMRDLSKVFQGILMCDKKKVINEIFIYRLWLHECTCVFGDRLINMEDKNWLRTALERNISKYTSIDVSLLWKESSDVIYADFMVAGVDSRVYEEVALVDLQSAVEVVAISSTNKVSETSFC